MKNRRHLPVDDGYASLTVLADRSLDRCGEEGHNVEITGLEPRTLERPYEIRFDGDVAELVQQVSPSAQVLDVPTYTILWQNVRVPGELDAMLDALIGMGITPHEVYGTGAGHRRTSYCEVRIGGLLGEALLQHLGWPHRVAQSTVILLRATHDNLRSVLAQMSAATEVDYVIALDTPTS
ncbi:MAG TPA: hypothetical protein VFU98_02750 [Microlunatus sp.]|nr:hypothetical protein [Microlunatus sp.]